MIIPLVRRIDFATTDLVLDGNSLTAYMTQAGNSTVYATLGASGRTKQNFGVGAQTTLNMIADAVTQIDSQYASNKILIVWEVRNDIYFGQTVAQAIANIRSYCNGRRAAGYKIVLIGALPTVATTQAGDSSAVFNQRLLDANAIMRRDWREFANAFVDVNAIPQIQDPTNTAIYYDNAHLSATGYGYLFPEINKTIARVRR